MIYYKKEVNSLLEEIKGMVLNKHTSKIPSTEEGKVILEGEIANLIFELYNSQFELTVCGRCSEIKLIDEDHMKH